MFIGHNSTAFGIACQPNSVGIFDYGIKMVKKDIKTVLWENVQTLMLAEFKKENLGLFAKKCGIGAASMTRIKEAKTSVRIDTVGAIAKAFGLEPWEMLVEGVIAQEELQLTSIYRQISPANRAMLLTMAGALPVESPASAVPVTAQNPTPSLRLAAKNDARPPGSDDYSLDFLVGETKRPVKNVSDKLKRVQKP